LPIPNTIAISRGVPYGSVKFIAPPVSLSLLLLML
jgi:hypothetical protein